MKIWHKFSMLTLCTTILLLGGIIIIVNTFINNSSHQLEARSRSIFLEQIEKNFDVIVRSMISGLDVKLDKLDITLNLEATHLSSELSKHSLTDASLKNKIITQTLTTLLSVDDLIQSVFYLAPDGSSMSLMKGKNIATYKSESIFPASTLKFWNDPYQNLITQRHEFVTDLRTPLKNNGGVLGISISISRLSRNLNITLPLHSNYIFIINKHRFLIAAPPQARIELASAQDYRDDSPITLLHPDNEELNASFSRMTAGQSGIDRVNLKGNMKYLIYHPSKVSSWSLGIVAPVSIAAIKSTELVSIIDNNTKAMLLSVVYWSTILLLIVSIISLFFIKHLVHPLQSIAVIAKKISQGDYNQRIVSSGNDEVAQLERAFNDMTDKISSLVNHLEDQVLERTHQLHLKNKELEHLSTTDTLTGVYNRTKLDAAFKAELQRADRYHLPFGIILIDIDKFKNINDDYGHLTGDQVLVTIAQTLKKCTRNTDIVGRWGGEEFLIICSNSNNHETFEAAEHLRKQIEIIQHPDLEYKKVTASLGVTEHKKNDTSEEMMLRVDKALYCAKDSGRNRVIVGYPNKKNNLIALIPQKIKSP